MPAPPTKCAAGTAASHPINIDALIAEFTHHPPTDNDLQSHVAAVLADCNSSPFRDRAAKSRHLMGALRHRLGHRADPRRLAHALARTLS